jgi:hypothetical protein
MLPITRVYPLFATEFKENTEQAVMLSLSKHLFLCLEV